MTIPTLTERARVTLLRVDGVEKDIPAAARMSTASEVTDDDGAGLIRYLMKHRHGSPFEHVGARFLVECPIFVAREFMRHRTLSFNEHSGRYSDMLTEAWVPSADRPLVQEGSSAHPKLVKGSEEQRGVAALQMISAYNYAFAAYESLLRRGVAREVARAVLPVGAFTRFVVSGNLRAWLSFLSLRVDSTGALFETKPQLEIEQAAREIEALLTAAFPITLAHFNETGRVSP